MGAESITPKWFAIWSLMLIGIISIGAWAFKVYLVAEPVPTLRMATAFGQIDILLYIGMALLSVTGTYAVITRMKEMNE